MMIDPIVIVRRGPCIAGAREFVRPMGLIGFDVT
jgi:hypothetical protein